MIKAVGLMTNKAYYEAENEAEIFRKINETYPSFKHRGKVSKVLPEPLKLKIEA